MGRHRWFRVLAPFVPLVLLAAACGDDDPAVSDGSPSPAGGGSSDISLGILFDPAGRGDQSFNDAAVAGIERAVEELGLEPAAELTPDEGGENREELLRLLAEEGTDLVFAAGSLFADAVTATARAFPDVTFGLVDGTVDEPNVASLRFAEEQGSYLIGAAAALTSTTGKIGFIGGVETPLVHRFEAGYVAGARQVDPEVEVDSKYISQPPDFSGINDPAKGKEIATGQFSAGADVIYAAGGSGGGLFEAARDTSTPGLKHWAIGVDSDQYELVDQPLKEFILTSMLKKVDVAVYETIKAVVEGEQVGGEETIFDLASDGVGYSTSGGHLPQEVLDQLEDLERRIIDGQIEVPDAP